MSEREGTAGRDTQRGATGQGGSPDRDGDKDRSGGGRQGGKERGPITNPHEGDASQTEPQEPRELENPPQERGPRERENNAV